ncbi:MAG: septal ring lytic transglycosylase RlpA family protein [Porticoccaceae bacterium]
MRSLLTVNRLILGLAVSGLFGCSSIPGMVEKDGAGKRIDTSVIPNATPKPEPITKAGNKSPYEVFGKTYWVMPSNKGYKESGVASWYGTKFHGRLTSNGEIYNMYGMTAAHKSLPIPSYARVTNTENGRSIIVRINDRGPFHDDRLIDLSFVGAMKLGYADKGTAKVLIEAIDTDPKPAPQPAPEPQIAKAATADSGQYLQVGAFTDLATAQQLKNKVRSLTSQPIILRTQDKLHKLWIGPIADNIELLSIKAMLKKSANLSAFSVTP